MLDIAIVEDEKGYSDTLEGYLKRYEQEHDVSIRTTKYKDATAFLLKYRPVFDVIFMDIQMPHLNGFDAAQHLREIDPKVQLVFVTSHAHYAPKGYDVSASGFLVKPVSYYNFYTLLDKLIRTATRDRENELIVHTREGIRVLLYSEIEYIEISGHNLKYVTEGGSLAATGSFTSLEKFLPKDCFVRCNNSFIVHLKFVKGVTGNMVQVGNCELPISRSRKKEFMFSLVNYFGDRI